MSKLKKTFTGPTYKLPMSLMVISDVHRSFIPNKTIFAKYCLTQWISKLPGNFDSNWVRQHRVNATPLAGKLYTTVYKNEPIITSLGHWQIVLIFNTAYVYIYIQHDTTWLLSAENFKRIGTIRYNLPIEKKNNQASCYNKHLVKRSQQSRNRTIFQIWLFIIFAKPGTYIKLPIQRCHHGPYEADVVKIQVRNRL